MFKSLGFEFGVLKWGNHAGNSAGLGRLFKIPIIGFIKKLK